MNLEGKVVVVVGGGGGIGRAGALALAEAGCSVVVADVDEGRARETAAEIERKGGRALPKGCDASDDTHLIELEQQSTTAFGHVDVLWMHAGASVAGPPERIPLDRWRSLFELNLLGGVRGLQAFVPAMLERGDGHLIFTTSGLGLFPQDVGGLAAPYVVTKAGQIALARTLAPYLAARGVGVSLLAPDITATRHTFEISTVDLDPADVAANLDLGVMQQPEDVARLLVEGLRNDVFLMSAVPNTQDRLVADARRSYGPTPDAGDQVVQYVRIEADADKHEELAGVLDRSSKSISREPGAVMHQVSSDVNYPGVFHIFEEWMTGADLDRHAATSESQAILGRMAEFGIAGLEVRRYNVNCVDDESARMDNASAASGNVG